MDNDLDLDILPTIPTLALKILRLDMDEEFDQALLEKLIMQCPIISLRILSIANSPSYRSHRPVVSLKDALLRIGLKNAHLIAYGVAIYSQQQQRPGSRLDMNVLWEHNLYVMDKMKKIAKEMKFANRPSDSEISLAAILHDIGFVILDKICPEKSDLFHLHNNSFAKTSSVVESDYFSPTHSYYSYLLLKKCGIQDNVCNAVKNHHDLPNRSFSSLTNLLQVADSCCADFSKDKHLDLKPYADLLDIDESKLLALNKF